MQWHSRCKYKNCFECSFINLLEECTYIKLHTMCVFTGTYYIYIHADAHTRDKCCKIFAPHHTQRIKWNRINYVNEANMCVLLGRKSSRNQSKYHKHIRLHRFVYIKYKFILMKFERDHTFGILSIAFHLHDLALISFRRDWDKINEYNNKLALEIALIGNFLSSTANV